MVRFKKIRLWTWKKMVVAMAAVILISLLWIYHDESPEYLPAKVEVLQYLPHKESWFCDIQGGMFTVDGHYAFYLSDRLRKDNNRHFLFHNGAAYPGFHRSAEGIIATSSDLSRVAYLADMPESVFNCCYINGQEACRIGEGFAFPAIDFVNDRIAYGQAIGWENSQLKYWRDFTESEKRTWYVYEGKRTFTVKDCDRLSLYYGKSKGPLVMKVERASYRIGECKLIVGDYSTPLYEHIEFLDCDSDGRLTYIANGPKSVMVRNGVKEIECDEIGLWLDSQSHGYIYTARTGPRCSVVVNGQSQGNYNGIGLRALGNVGGGYAYVAYVDGFEAVVNNGKEVGKFDEVHYLACANDGGVAYVATKGEKTFAYLNGQVRQIDELAKKYWISPDGKHLACKYELEGDGDGGGEYVVIDGVRSDTYRSVGDVQFSPDGGHYAYSVHLKDDLRFASRKNMNFLTGMLFRGHCTANTRTRDMVIFDGKRGPVYERILFVGFRPGGGLVYFVIADGKLYFVAV